MSLESGTYINSLTISNPKGTDQKHTLDDHTRLIKSTLLNTFPLITGAISASPTELNYLKGLGITLQDQITARVDVTTLVTATSITIGPLATVDVTLTTMTGFRVIKHYAYPDAGNTKSAILGPPNTSSAIFVYRIGIGTTDYLRFESNMSATMTMTYGVRMFT